MIKFQRSNDLLLAFLVTCAMNVTSPPLRAAEGDEAAIATTAEAFVEAFDKGDAKAVAAFWTPSGDYIDQTGQLFKGREAIEEAFSQFFAENKGLKLGIESESLRFPTPDTAIEDGVSSVLAPDGMPSRARYTNVFVKK